FTAQAADPNAGDVLRFTAKGLPEGAVLDAATGQVHWMPGPGQVGDYTTIFTVTDGLASAAQAVSLRAAPTLEAPHVLVEVTPSCPVTPGQRTVIHVAATSLADITGLTLTIDGQPLPLDAQGRAEYTPAAPGRYALAATATDADGLQGLAT